MTVYRDTETGEIVTHRTLHANLRRGAWDGHELDDEPGEVWVITDEDGRQRIFKWVSDPDHDDPDGEFNLMTA